MEVERCCVAGDDRSAVGQIDDDAGRCDALVGARCIVFDVVVCTAGVKDGGVRCGGMRGWTENAGSMCDNDVFGRGGGKVWGNDSVVVNKVFRPVSVQTGKLYRPSDLDAGNRIRGGVDAGGSTHHVVGCGSILVVRAFADACSTGVAVVFAEPVCVAVGEGFRCGLVAIWNLSASAVVGELGNLLLQLGNLVTVVSDYRRRSMYRVGCVKSDGFGRGVEIVVCICEVELEVDEVLVCRRLITPGLACHCEDACVVYEVICVHCDVGVSEGRTSACGKVVGVVNLLVEDFNGRSRMPRSEKADMVRFEVFSFDGAVRVPEVFEKLARSHFAVSMILVIFGGDVDIGASCNKLFA